MKSLVVLAPGWTGSGVVFDKMKKRLEEENEVFVPGYRSFGFDNIRPGAKRLYKQLRGASEGFDEVHYVGHSMGGLLGRYMVQKLGFTDLKTYISLGTPHHGTHLAKLAPWSPSAKQMCPGSRLLQNLNSIDWPEHIRAISMVGDLEQIVIPKQNALYGPFEKVIVKGADHVSIPMNRYVIDKVTEIIGS